MRKSLLVVILISRKKDNNSEMVKQNRPLSENGFFPLQKKNHNN